MILLAAVVFLYPTLSEDAPLRMATAGTGLSPVEWRLDGLAVATTREGLAASVDATAGNHTLAVASDAPGPWEAMARIDSRGVGVSYVPAWTGRATQAARGPAWPAGLAVGLIAAAACAAAARHPKRP